MTFSDLVGAGILMAYYLMVVGLVPTLVRVWTKTPVEVVRKAQHILYSLSIFVLLNFFSTWYMAVLAAALLVILAYPVLLLVEKSHFYEKYFVDRLPWRGGELRKQLIYVQLSFAVLIFVCWGLLGYSWHYVAAVAVVGWGFGDATAALVGKAWGRRHVIHRLVERAKTLEGTGAMIVVSAGAMFFTLLFYAGISWYLSLAISIIVAPVCGLVELFSRKGTDTLTVPFSAALLVMSFMYLFSLLGWY